MIATAQTGKHKDGERRFYHLSQAWYGERLLKTLTVVDELSMGFYHADGSTTGEFRIQWERLDDEIIPRLVVYNDGWDALWRFRDVLEKLASLDGQNPTPNQVAGVLKSCDVKDATPREKPHEE